MTSTDIELEQQLKEAGKKLSHPPATVDELLPLLDQVEKLLCKVDQSPKKSMLDALGPSMKALVEESLFRHSDADVKAAVASCISEITRITAPDAPYDDDQMRDVFQLIVSSFENLSDTSSRSYEKRASILETVSKVRSCVIMLDLECDGLIVEMFEYFLKSVRDYHVESVYSSMETIMVLVLEESEEISVEMLKPLLASVKNNSEGVLPVARKLGEGVLQKSAAKLRPYMMPALKSLGDSVDNYSQVVALICEGATAAVEHNDENTSVPQLADESKLVKGPLDEAQQDDERKRTSALSDETDQVVKENAEGPCPEEVDPTSDRSAKSVMSNGVIAMGNEEASVDQESSKKPGEAIDQSHLTLASKDDPGDSDAEKLAKSEPKPEQTSKRRGKKSDGIIDSAAPSDSSHVEDKEIEKLPDNQRSSSMDVRNSPGKVSSEAVAPSEIKKDGDILVSSTKETKNESVDISSPSRSSGLPDDNCVKKVGRSKKKQVLQQDNVDAADVASPSQSGSLDDESHSKKGGLSKNKCTTLEDAPSMDVASTKLPEGTTDSDIKPQRQAGKKAVASKEIQLRATVGPSEDGEATSDSDAKPLKKSSKKGGSVKTGSKSGKQLNKKVGSGESKKPKQSGKKTEASGESEAKKPKQAGKKVDAGDSKGKPSRQLPKEEEESDSDAKPLKLSVKKAEKRGVETKPSKHTVEKGEGVDSETKPLKLSVKKGDTSNSTDVKFSSKKKDDGKKPGRGKHVAEKDQAKSLSEDDEMDTSPKSAAKTAKGEDNKKATPATGSKRKRSTGKDKASQASNNIQYDGSMVGLKVKVYWPEDKTYYEGVIESFDPAKKKHKVAYVDGDEEILNLRKQKMEILTDFSVPTEGQAAEDQTDDGCAEITKKKKSKTDSVPSASQEKGKDSSKRAGGASSSGKSKGSSAKSARNSKSEGKTDNNSKDSGIKSTPQKNSGKSTVAVSKEAGKSKENEETPKPSSKTKQETSKTVNKSKGKTPQIGNKDNGNGSSKAKSGSSNVKESEETKVKSSDAAKAPEETKGKSTDTVAKTGSKSGKKRKKRS